MPLHVEAYNKRIIKQESVQITKIILRCTVSKTSKLLKHAVEGKTEGDKWWQEENKAVRRSWMTLGKRQDTGNWKKKL